MPEEEKRPKKEEVSIEKNMSKEG
jgi:hypothetical protein